MNTVSFPGLGLTFEISKIAFTVGDIPVYWYGVIIAFGMLIAIETCAHIGKYFGITSSELYNMVLIVIPISILGARLYYVIFNFNEISTSNILNIKQGGLAIYGGIITSIIILYIYCKVTKIKFLAFGDLGLIGMFIGQIIGRLGNFMNIEAFGYETALPWRMRIPYQNVVGYIDVHPTFLYEMIWNIIGLTIVLIITLRNKRKFDGQIFFTYIAWYGLGRFFIEGLRTDSLYIGSIRISQLVGIVSFICSLLVLVVSFNKASKDKNYKDKLYINTRNELGGK